MTGFIICGYPGVGKSSIAGWNGCIDLESSFFAWRNSIPQKLDNWVPQYCRLAADLALQGFTVLVSTHKSVINYFTERLSKGQMEALKHRIVIFCPDFRYKDEWIKRLQSRLNTEDSVGYEKNKRALMHAEECFESDIHFLNNCGLPVIIPSAMDYDLKHYITNLQHVMGEIK